MFWHRGSSAIGGIDGEVLAELRGIRGDLQNLGERVQNLAERVAQSATREDLDDYVTKEVFNAHVSSSVRAGDLLRGWLPIGIATFALLWSVVSPYIHFGAR